MNEGANARATMLGLARNIAQLMAIDIWAVLDDENAYDDSTATIYLVGSSPRCSLSIWHDRHRKKLVIRGKWPQAKDRREFGPPAEERPSIAVSDHRDIPGIARDINRKLLPDYLNKFARARADVIAHNVYLDCRKKLVSLVALAVGGEVAPSGERINGGPRAGSKIGYIHDMYVNATDETVSFDLRGVPVETALKMFRVWLDRDLDRGAEGD